MVADFQDLNFNMEDFSIFQSEEPNDNEVTIELNCQCSRHVQVTIKKGENIVTTKNTGCDTLGSPAGH